MKSAFYFIIFLLFIGTTVDAKNCTFTDLRAELGPARKQGNMGWCYANSAADLLSYEYKDELKNQPISAVYTALTYNQSSFQNSLFEGGFVFWALKKSINEGLCPMDIEDSVLNEGYKLKLKEKLNYLNRWKLHYDKQNGKNLSSFFQQISKTNSILNQIPEHELKDIFENSNQKDFLKNLADRLCQNRKIEVSYKHKIKTLSTYFLDSSEKMVLRINDQLEKNNIIALAYYATFFDSWEKAKSVDRHMSVIVGRRPSIIRGQCEYLIRNSWGERCDTYKNKGLNPTKNCEKGHIWIPELVLKRYMYGVTYFDKTDPL